MNQIKNLLTTRKSHLLQLKSDAEAALKIAPAGFLRIGRHGDRLQYYHRTAPKDSTGKYIREKDIQLACDLAQKDYNQKVLRAASQELKAIDKYFSALPAKKAEDIYETLTTARKQLILPIEEPEAQYIQNWLAVPYQGKSFDEHTPEFYTANGERVRSKSEIIIADLLARYSIPYRYESPLHLNGFGRVHPDFTVLNVKLRKELYWEHLGMMDDPAYAEKALQKISAYEQNGIYMGENLILTYETRQNPINQRLVLQKIQHYLQ